MKKNLYLGLSALIISVFTLGAEAKVEGIRITADADYVNIFWNQLEASQMSDLNGYAIQWSDRQSDVVNTFPANIYEKNVGSISLRRGSFESNRTYYLRVYTYLNEGVGKNIPSHGSDMIKWSISNLDEVTIADTINVTDAVITSSEASGTTTVDTSDFEFGALRASYYDTFADFSWSRPYNMASSDYDGFRIEVSESADATDPIVFVQASPKTYKARIMGLSPETNYYAKGYFYKGAATFGDSAIKSFKTHAVINRSGNTSASRNLAKIERKPYAAKASVGGSSTTTTTSSTSTSHTQSSSNTTSSSSTSSIQARIKALKSQIQALQTELSSLEKKIGVTPSTSSVTRTSTSAKTIRTSKKSIRQLLAERRAAKNK